MATLRQLLALEPTTSQLEICAEVELSTATSSAKRCKLAVLDNASSTKKKESTKKKQSAGASIKSKEKASKKGSAASTKKGRGKGKSSNQPMFSREEKREIAQVDKGRLGDYVKEKVCNDIFAESFPERAVVWEHMKRSHQLDTIICSSSERYAELYSSNTASSRDKNAALFLNWLDYVRTWTCNEERIATVDAEVSNATKRTVLATVFNAIYQGLCLQMAEAAEQISNSKHVAYGEAKPSDEVAMHRICGWALKSVSDQYKHKVDYSTQLSLISMLKLPKEEKHLLPLPVQYLDRGGLTFLRQELWPWMLAVEKKMVRHLNQASYRQFGSKLFEVF